MSLVARPSANHPRQVMLRGGADDLIDCRETPLPFWTELDRVHRFTLDAAANAENAKCRRYFDREQNGLTQSWAREVVWCNPPFSACAAWVAKALAEVRLGCPKVVMLLPANRTEQPWWQEMIEPVRDRGLGVTSRFVAGRLRFRGATTQGDAQKPSENRPPFGVVLIEFTPPPSAPVALQ